MSRKSLVGLAKRRVVELRRVMSQSLNKRPKTHQEFGLLVATRQFMNNPGYPVSGVLLVVRTVGKMRCNNNQNPRRKPWSFGENPSRSQ